MEEVATFINELFQVGIMVLDHDLIVLGFLAEKPMSGYELKRMADLTESCSGMAFSSIYHILGRLQKQGQVKKGQDGSKHYALTPMGRKRFHIELKTALSQGIPDYDAYYSGLAFAHHLTETQLKTCLAKRRRQLAAEYARLDTFALPDTLSHELMWRRASALLKAELSWLDKESVRKGHGRTPGGNEARAGTRESASAHTGAAE